MIPVKETKSVTIDAMLRHLQLGLLNQQDFSSMVSMGGLEFYKVCTASKINEVAVTKKTDSKAWATGRQIFSDNQGAFEAPSSHSVLDDLDFMDDFNLLVLVKYLV